MVQHFPLGRRREIHPKQHIHTYFFSSLPLNIHDSLHQICEQTKSNRSMKLIRYLGFASLKSKCKKMIRLFSKLRLRKPVSIRSLHSRRRKGGRLSKLTSAFRRRDEREIRDMDRVTELTSFSDQKAPHSSPLTPAYVRMSTASKAAPPLDHDHDGDGVEDACRSFEKYLMEMIVAEEGKFRDLGDVEELLYCWKELRSPVFLDLVCRFYRELCTDLFSNDFKT